MGISEETNLNAGANKSGIPGSSVNGPAPLGFTVKTTIERGDAYLSPEIYNVEITILEAVRGSEALERLRSQGAGDKSPEAGHEYVLAYIRFGYFQRGRRAGSEAYELKEGLFVAVSADGQQEYGIPVDPPQPQSPLTGQLFNNGDSHEGWILLQVPTEEKEPRLAFKRKHVEGMYGIWGYVWFGLHK
jgi:hypothetical protein